MSTTNNGTCLICERPRQHASATYCDTCWETTSRLSGFLSRPKAVQFVCQELADADTRFACLRNLGTDEPVFILKAKDKFASAIVEVWASLVRKAGTPAAKYKHALATADAMDLWGRENGTKVPD